MDEKTFFKNLLEKTKEVFLTSQTYKEHGEKNWNYAVCDTPIQKNTGIFFGLNWGGKDIDKQSTYPERIKPRNWNFITHSRAYFREYLGKEIEQLNYSNLCFFRSPKVHQLISSDWELAIPLFRKYVDYINPPWTLMLGKPNHLWEKHIENKNYKEFHDNKYNKTVYGYTGLLFGKYPFAAVPHPQARVSSETRKEIWKCVVKENRSVSFPSTKSILLPLASLVRLMF